MEHILSFAAEHGLFPKNGLILCALSGGADSVALLHFLKTHGLWVAAAHFDHHLRPTSGRDALFVQEFCQELGVDLYLGGGQVGDLPGNTEENARNARYAFLERIADAIDAAAIATAHNANDNLETVLLHMTRGCGLQGLSGIQPKRGRLIRPMLHTTRAAIEDYLAEQGLPHITDETNADDSYARNRIRHQVVPVLESLNPRAVEAAARMTDRLREDLALLPPRAAQAPAEALPPLAPVAVPLDGRVETPLWTVETRQVTCPDVPPTPEIFYLKRQDALALRSRQTGDFLHPPFRTGKTVKKWLIELGVPRWAREAVPVLVDGEGRVLAVAGLGPQAAALAEPGEYGIYVRWIKR